MATSKAAFVTRLVLLALSLSLIACASSPPRYKAYRLEVKE